MQFMFLNFTKNNNSQEKIKILIQKFGGLNSFFLLCTAKQRKHPS